MSLVLFPPSFPALSLQFTERLLLFLSISPLGRISGLNDEVKEVKSSLFKALSDKKQLQKKLNDLEKVSGGDFIEFFSFLPLAKKICRRS